MSSERVFSFVYIMSSDILSIGKFTPLLTIKLPTSKALLKKEAKNHNIIGIATSYAIHTHCSRISVRFVFIINEFKENSGITKNIWFSLFLFTL